MIILILVILGLCLGSFVNALVWRIHEQDASSSKGDAALSVFKGRSMCPHCRHSLSPLDLIPVVSWLALYGKCRYCHKPIAKQYPAVELLTAGLFVLSYACWPRPVQGVGAFELVIWLVMLVGFVALGVYDIKWFVLPSNILYPLLGLAVVQVAILATVFGGGTQTVLSAFWGVLIIGGTFYGLFQVSGGKWIGGGDVRLGVLLGLLVGGPAMSLLLIFLASTSGTVFSAPLLLRQKLRVDSRIPFGPFLLIGAILTRLFGAAIIGWYKAHLLGL